MKRSPDSLASKIYMIYKEEVPNVFILFEGKSDYNIWNDNFSHKFNDKVHIEFSGDKDTSIETLKKIYQEYPITKNVRMKGVIAIVDADYDHITSKHIFSHTCVFRTDFHDIDIMILNSDAFKKVFNRLCEDKGRLKHHLNNFFNITIDNEELILHTLIALLEIAKKIGIIRWINHENDFMLDFKNLNYPFLLDEHQFKINFEKLMHHIISKNGKKRDFKLNLQELFTKEMEKNLNVNQVCQGHDAIAILTIWFNYLFCRRDASSKFQFNDIKNLLDIGYEFRYFKESKLYEYLCKWESDNLPFKIFKP